MHCCTHKIVLLKLAQHDYGGSSCLPNHPPEVKDGEVQGSLCQNELVPTLVPLQCRGRGTTCTLIHDLDSKLTLAV